MSATEGQSPLHKACHNRQVGQVKRILAKSKDIVNQYDIVGDTALHIACAKDDFNKGVLELLKAGANINASGRDGRKPLMVAAEENLVDIATTLLQKGADVNQTDHQGFTALHYSCEQGLETMTNLLLSNSAVVNSKDGNGRTPLYLACKCGSLPIVQVLVMYKAKVNVQTTTGKVALHQAAANNHADILRILLERQPEGKSKVNAQCKVTGETPLSMAVKANHVICVEELLDNGADPNLECEDKSGRNTSRVTPLCIAVDNNYIGCVSAILKQGNVTDYQFHDGTSYLSYAIDRKNTEIALPLARVIPQVNMTTRDGYSVLYLACKQGLVTVVETLLARGAGLGRATHWITNRYTWLCVRDGRAVSRHYSTPTPNQEPNSRRKTNWLQRPRNVLGYVRCC